MEAVPLMGRPGKISGAEIKNSENRAFLVKCPGLESQKLGINYL